MKKNTLHILLVILIIFQVVSIMKIGNLQRQIENTHNEMNNLSNYIKRDMDSIYSNVDAMLRQEASLIESAAAKFGTINADELTVLITFTLTPKEVSDHTIVSLDFDGELFPMEKNGTTFSTTVSRNIFGSAMPKIVIGENGVKKTTQDNQISISSIKQLVFPTLIPRFVGGGSYGGNVYEKKGSIGADVKAAETAVREDISQIEFVKVRLVVKVDDEVISDEALSNETLSAEYEIDKAIPLSKGQTCTITFIATDSIGFEHHHVLDHYVAGSNSQREPMMYDGQIYSADGKLLWKPEYEQIGQ